MDKKRGFSFLEMLIVIMIVGILFVVFKTSFQVKNKDVLYGQACIETIYGEINNFLHAAISSKSINSWGTQIFPDTYIISFIPAEQSIKLWYQSPWNSYSIYSTISITGHTSNYCSDNDYLIVLTGDTYEVHISKWLQATQERSFFYLSWVSTSTGANIFLQYETSGTWCRTMARFESDTRIINIKKQMCLSFTGAVDCLEWDN